MNLRTRADVDDEIASENRAISRIEEAIDNYVPPTCSFCTASAMDACVRCERPMCEDDSGVGVPDVCLECFTETFS